MPYKGKSPNKFLGGIAASISAGMTGAGSSMDNNALREKLKSSVFGGAAFEAMQRKQSKAAAAAAAAPQAPSVVQTAGATNMGQRINTIESRLQALEGSQNSNGGVVPEASITNNIDPVLAGAGVVPPETQADINISNEPQAVMNSVIPTAQPQAAASEELGSLMASPFTMRQRENMGPLMFKDQTGDGKITRADVIKARVEGYKK